MLERTTQPMTDAVIERPMTLIEKLEKQRDAWFKQHKEYCDMEARSRGCAIDECIDIVKQHSDWVSVDEAINIVKQHQSWRKMPSDEKPQDMQAYNLLLKNDSREYPTLYGVGLFRQYPSGHVWVSLVEAEKYIDESKILAWQPMSMPNDEFFENLKQPPIEVQDD